MSKADFYTWGKRGLDWVGSLYNQGEPWYIPTEILSQINKLILYSNFNWNVGLQYTPIARPQ